MVQSRNIHIRRDGLQVGDVGIKWSIRHLVTECLLPPCQCYSRSVFNNHYSLLSEFQGSKYGNTCRSKSFGSLQSSEKSGAGQFGLNVVFCMVIIDELRVLGNNVVIIFSYLKDGKK